MPHMAIWDISDFFPPVYRAVSARRRNCLDLYMPLCARTCGSDLHTVAPSLLGCRILPFKHGIARADERWRELLGAR